MPSSPDFAGRTIPAFPRSHSNLALISTETGAEIMPGMQIPEPYGRGTVTYLGATVRVVEAAGPGQRTVRVPGRVAVVRYADPETDWTYLPAQLGAQYFERPERPPRPAADGTASHTDTTR
ncbi:hypothetical protein [Kitasatospora sp. NPDC088134]|uniref:hypothetical protein n=1 Tax=Kitasatospora sp. NPDC088134 TaxID=3364071 RepID=UPI00381CE3AD